MFSVARAYLEEQLGWRVLAGLLSPSSFSYLRSKLGQDALGDQVRLEACRVALREEPSLASLRDWVNVDPWECAQPRFVDFPEVLRSLQAQVAADDILGPLPGLRVLFLCGQDLCANCRLWDWCGAIPLPLGGGAVSFPSSLV